MVVRGCLTLVKKKKYPEKNVSPEELKSFKFKMAKSRISNMAAKIQDDRQMVVKILVDLFVVPPK